MTVNNDDAYYQAMLGRDARFDGCFFTGVTSTGIYCRPVCRVKAPKRENCRFFGHAAQAESAGFRPCMRCRPELAPLSLVWSTQDASHTLALQAAHLLDNFFSGSVQADGAPDLPTVASVAARLGVSDRHLRRIFEAHLGVSPVQYLQTRRLLSAKQLLTDTGLPMTQVAQASGFASLRRFNAAFLQHYRFSPTQLRKGSQEGEHAGGKAAGKTAKALAGSIRVQMAYRPPYDVEALLGFMRKRQLSTIESVAAPATFYEAARTFGIHIAGKQHAGWVRFAFDTARSLVLLEVSDSLGHVLPTVIARMRAALDLDADPAAINAVLGPHFAGTEGLRVPGCMDGYEVALRAIAGQQVTVAAGRTLVQRVADAYGLPIATPYPELSRLFPTPSALAQATPDALGALGIVKQRQTAIIALSRAVDSGALDLNTPANALATIEQLKTLPGIGDWTAHYIAMRALRWPDAFPAGDVALHNALGVRGEKHPARAAEAASQAWRPWRSYAVLRAWHSLSI
jgi:AraC family transcriptional regulator, regulatory protein of adaptative response / DNA-3-methyladenine glycosylase II